MTLGEGVTFLFNGIFCAPADGPIKDSFRIWDVIKDFFNLIPDSKTILHGPICGGTKNSIK